MTAIGRKRHWVCSSRLGSLAIGYFSLCQAVVGIGVILLGFSLFMYDRIHDKRGTSDVSDLMLSVLVVSLLINVIHIVVSNLLLRGIRKGKPGLLVPWMLATGVAVVMLSMGLLMCHFHEFYHPVLLGVLAALAVLDSGCVAVVASHYRHLGRRSIGYSSGATTSLWNSDPDCGSSRSI